MQYGLGTQIVAYLASCALGLAFHSGRCADTPEHGTATGWKLLFDGQTTKEWRSFKGQTFPTNGWTVEDGWLHCSGQKGGDIVTKEEYEQFELEWEWKIPPLGNSGIKYFLLESRSSAIGHEYQMYDEGPKAANKPPGKQSTASFYDVLAPANVPPKPPGEINRSRILVRGQHVEHWLNGAKVLEYDCGSERVKAGVANSKFKSTPGFGSRVKGRILLQDHSTEAWFRNIRIRDLSGAKD